MQSMLGQLIAMIVATVIIFIIANVNLRVQRGAIAATQYRASKTSQTDLIGMIDRDFRNIGSTYPNFVLNPDSAIISFDSSGVFSFYGQPARGQAPVEIKYEWQQSGTVRVDTGYVPAYSVSRTVDGSEGGGSAGSVTEFSLRLLDNNGNPTGTLSQTRQIEVNLAIISSLGANELTESNNWQTVIRPTALAR